MELEQRLGEMEETIQLNPSYIQKLMGPIDEDMPPQPVATPSSI